MVTSSASESAEGVGRSAQRLGLDAWMRQHSVLDHCLFLLAVFLPAWVAAAVANLTGRPDRFQALAYSLYGLIIYFYAGRRLALDRDPKLRRDLTTARLLGVDVPLGHPPWWREWRPLPLVGSAPVSIPFLAWSLFAVVAVVVPIRLTGADSDDPAIFMLCWLLLYAIAITELWAVREKRRAEISSRVALALKVADGQLTALRDQVVDLNDRISELTERRDRLLEVVDDLENGDEHGQIRLEDLLHQIHTDLAEDVSPLNQWRRESQRLRTRLLEHSIQIIGGAIAGILLTELVHRL